MILNPEISKLLTKSGITVKEGTTYLLSLYFNTIPNYIPAKLVQKMNLTKIYQVDTKTKTLNWNVPLFLGQDTKFEWVKKYREAFREKNKERGGTIKACVSRMKKFFAENPHVREQDVKEAVALYFQSLKDYDYLKSAHKFIYEGSGAGKVSLLEEWLERLEEVRHESNNRNSLRNTMQ